MKPRGDAETEAAPLTINKKMFLAWHPPCTQRKYDRQHMFLVQRPKNLRSYGSKTAICRMQYLVTYYKLLPQQTLHQIIYQ
jgi:hypothetical protein